MTLRMNRTIVLAKHPQGGVQLDDFKLLRDVEIPELKDGEVLVENKWLSIDPYTRPRLDKKTPMVEPIPIDHVIQGETIGVVVDSNNTQFSKGDWVFTLSGWQRYYIANKQDMILRKLSETTLPKSIFLGPVGTAGRAAYFGMQRIAKPQPGDVVVVSAAAGAVGSVAGQIAKMAGAYVVGIAGGETKCHYVVDELGFDACVDYKADDFKKQLRRACPEGIDVYFENVGGRVSMFVAQLLNDGARVPVCGNVSQYNTPGDMGASGPEAFFASLPSAPLAQFFLVTQWFKDYPESDEWLLKAIESGQIKYRETVYKGLELAPQAFTDLFVGRNIGKQLVELE